MAAAFFMPARANQVRRMARSEGRTALYPRGEKMAEETTEQQPQGGQTEGQEAQEPQQQQAEPQGQQHDAEPDYKALYEQAKAQSRKWEKRAKDNSAKKTLEERVSELEALNEQLKQQAEHSAAVQRVAESTGVPASLLRGDTEDDIRAFADAIKQYAGSQTVASPQDTGGASTGTKATKATIAAIKDPQERMRAIMDNITLYR